jgi:cell division protein FtsL
MIKVINAMLVVAVLFSAAKLYRLEHETRGLERTIVKIERDIEQRKEEHKLLRAEWASLTRPERIQKLAVEKLKLQPVRVDQIVTPAELAARLTVLSIPPIPEVTQ